MIENRRDHRETVRMRVDLNGPRCAASQGEIRDISLGGAFIHLRNAPPQRNSIVNLQFSPAGELDTAHQCRAMVVRKSKDGIGVMFARRQPQLMPNNANANKPAIAQPAKHLYSKM